MSPPAIVATTEASTASTQIKPKRYSRGQKKCATRQLKKIDSSSSARKYAETNPIYRSTARRILRREIEKYSPNRGDGSYKLSAESIEVMRSMIKDVLDKLMFAIHEAQMLDSRHIQVTKLQVRHAAWAARLPGSLPPSIDPSFTDARPIKEERARVKQLLANSMVHRAPLLSRHGVE